MLFGTLPIQLAVNNNHAYKDRRALPAGCATHFDAQRQRWYYVHLHTIPPRVTFVHPADETPPSPQYPQVSLRTSIPQQQLHHQQSTTSFAQAMTKPASPPQQPSRVSPPSANSPVPTPIQSPPTVQNQRRPSYGSTPSTSPVQDYAPPQRQQQQSPSPTVNMPSPFSMHRSRAPSEAQSIYSAAVPQTAQSPLDTSRMSIYTTGTNVDLQELEFDASILYSSPTSVPSSSLSTAISQNLQPQRRHVTPPDGSNSFAGPLPIQAANNTRSHTQAAPTTQRFQSHNVLRRKAKTASSFSASFGNNPKPFQPTVSAPKPREVPTYTMVAQAPLDIAEKPTTPAFQASLYSKPPIFPEPSNFFTNPNQGSGSTQATRLHAQPHTQMTSSNQVFLGSTSVSNPSTQGLINSQFPLSMQPNLITQPVNTATPGLPLTMPQHSLLPLRSQTTGHTVTSATSPISSVSLMNNRVLPSMPVTQPSPGLSNGMVTPSLNLTPSLMPAQPQLSNGTGGLAMASMALPFNQPQALMSNHSQLNDLPNGTSPPATFFPTSMSPRMQLNNNIFPNGMLPAGAMAQTMSIPQQPNMLPNGYAPGVQFGIPATQIQAGIPGMAQPMVNNVGQQAPPKDDKNKQLMKKVGMSLGKVAVKLGTKYALEQMGVDDSVAGVAASLTATGAEAAMKAANK